MKQKGFTLIELLVVVAIIGILAAVGVVAYNGYTTAAKKSVAKTNQKNVVRWLAAEAQKCQMGAEKVKVLAFVVLKVNACSDKSSTPSNKLLTKFDVNELK